MQYSIRDYVKQKMKLLCINRSVLDAVIINGSVEYIKNNKNLTIYSDGNYIIFCYKNNVVNFLKDESLSKEQIIEYIKVEADQLAVNFKFLFEEASIAYASGDTKGAKQLSVKGNAFCLDCEYLNMLTTSLVFRKNNKVLTWPLLD